MFGNKINQALVCDGFEFIDHNTRGRYIGTDVAKRPQFLKEFQGKWRKVSDVLKKTEQRAPFDDAAVKADPVSPLSHFNGSDSENGVTEAAADLSTRAALLPHRAPEIESARRVADSLPMIVGNALTINGRSYVTTEQLTRLFGVSTRTLHRLFKDGKGPHKTKIPDTLYELDEVLKWAGDHGCEIKHVPYIGGLKKE
jgi:hypothetical protein